MNPMPIDFIKGSEVFVVVFSCVLMPVLLVKILVEAKEIQLEEDILSTNS